MVKIVNQDQLPVVQALSWNDAVDVPYDGKMYSFKPCWYNSWYAFPFKDVGSVMNQLSKGDEETSVCHYDFDGTIFLKRPARGSGAIPRSFETPYGQGMFFHEINSSSQIANYYYNVWTEGNSRRYQTRSTIGRDTRYLEPGLTGNYQSFTIRCDVFRNAVRIRSIEYNMQVWELSGVVEYSGSRCVSHSLNNKAKNLRGRKDGVIVDARVELDKLVGETDESFPKGTTTMLKCEPVPDASMQMIGVLNKWEREVPAVLAHADYRETLADLSDQVLSSINANTNMLAFAKESPEMFSQLSAYSKLVRDHRGSKTFLKSLSSAELATRYGITLTVQDVKDFIDSVKRNIILTPATCRKGDFRAIGDWTVSTHYSLKYSATDPRLGRSIWLMLEGLGLNPNASNLWDLVPYSFAANWVVDISAIMKMVDNTVKTVMLPIIWEIYSVKASREVEVFGSKVTFEHYERHVSRLPTIMPRPSEIRVWSITQHTQEATELYINGAARSLMRKL